MDLPRDWSERKKKRHEAALRPKSRQPKESPQIKGEVLTLLRGGCTLTEICERRDMPSYSTLCEWRTHDADFANQVAEAMQYQCEYLIKDSADLVQREAEKDAVDTDRQKVMTAYADVAIKYAAALAPRKFGALAKMGADVDATPAIHIVAFGSAPMVGAGMSEVVSAREGKGSAIPPETQGVDHGTAKSPRTGNHARVRSSKVRDQVKANRNTTRKAKRHKQGA